MTKRVLFRTERGKAIAVSETPEQRAARQEAAAVAASERVRLTPGQLRALRKDRSGQ